MQLGHIINTHFLRTVSSEHAKDKSRPTSINLRVDQTLFSISSIIYELKNQEQIKNIYLLKLKF